MTASRISVVRIGPDEVRLTGVDAIRGYGRNRDNSFMHCLELSLEAMGRPIDYDELMGLSGAAFRVQFCRIGWCPGAADALAGYDCVAPVMASVGVTYQAYFTGRPDDAERERLRRDIVASIDKGLPILASNIIPPDWGVIVGYRRDGRTWFGRGYTGESRKQDRAVEQWPPVVVTLSDPAPIADMRPAYLASIGRAVTLFDSPRAGEYLLGRAAIEQWIRSLEQVTDRSYIQPNAWLFVSLIDARVAASRYLRRIAPTLGPYRAALEKAADLYAQEATLLDARRSFAPFPADFPSGMPPERHRQRQIQALQLALALEVQAVDLLRGVAASP
jgi:hypothetical protein